MQSARSFTFRILIALILCAGARGVEYGSRDAEFARVPFEEWLAGGKQSHINWSVEVVPAELSAHQRLLSRIAVTLDGRELEKRRGDGEFIAFIQYQDASGHVWQNHTTFNLAKLQPGMQTRNIVIGHFAFVLPGDYAVALALWHTVTGEHCMLKRHVHVGAPSNDPLPAAWAGLPAVEFIPTPDVPDSWFLPGIEGRLHLPVSTRRPVHVVLLVNTTSSERNAGSVGALRRNMSLLIPAMKVMSAMRLSEGSLEVSLLDLTHRKVVFEQNDAKDIEWRRMREFFVEANPGVVDVGTLANEWKMRSYFWDEVSRHMMRQDGAAHVVVVLSGPAFLGDQEPLEVPWEAADPDHRLIYIRYRPDPLRSYGQRRFRPGARPMPPPVFRPMPVDDLERTVEPLHARLFDAVSAEQFRRILAAVIEEISHL